MLFVAILVFSTFSSTAFASTSGLSTSQLNKVKAIDGASESIELVDLSEVPKGAPMIEFETVEEFEKAIQELDKENQRADSVVYMEDTLGDFYEIGSDDDELIVQGTGSTVKVFTVLTKPSFNWIMQQVQPTGITVDLEYSYSGSGSSRNILK
ncbi:hypothetical protein CV093_10160 [Oceanobacillus sp. 143]|nr:hypothetical protein CV093_10160 [Oceanobacillus sp. 143]